MKERTFRIVPHHYVLDYARLGWDIAEANIGYHAEWAVLMEWLCNCPIREPKERCRARNNS